MDPDIFEEKQDVAEGIVNRRIVFNALIEFIDKHFRFGVNDSIVFVEYTIELVVYYSESHIRVNFEIFKGVDDKFANLVKFFVQFLFFV